MCDNSSLYNVLQTNPFFRIFSDGWIGNPDCFALKHIPHIGGHFKTLTFRIGRLGAEIFTRNHKLIPIYNYRLCKVASHDFIWRLQNWNCISFQMTLGKKHPCLTHLSRPFHAYKYVQFCLHQQAVFESSKRNLFGVCGSIIKILLYLKSN